MNKVKKSPAVAKAMAGKKGQKGGEPVNSEQ